METFAKATIWAGNLWEEATEDTQGDISMVRNWVNIPRVKPCICERCHDGYVGGLSSKYCQKCYKPNGRNSKRLNNRRK
jgi:hypothetical protein